MLYRVHENILFVPIPSQMSQVQDLLVCQIHFNIIISSKPMSSKRSHIFSFPTKTLRAFLFSHIQATCPAHLIYHHSISLIMLDEENQSRSSSFYNVLRPTITSSLLAPNTFLSNLLSNTRCLFSSLDVPDQVSCQKIYATGNLTYVVKYNTYIFMK